MASPSNDEDDSLLADEQVTAADGCEGALGDATMTLPGGITLLPGILLART